MKEVYVIAHKLRSIHALIGLSVGMMLLHHLTADHAFADKGFYSIQVATFKDLEETRKKVLELKALGHQSFHTEEREGPGRLYRVCIERFRTKREAEKEAGALKQLGLISDYSIRAVHGEKEHSGAGTAGEKESGKGIFYLHVYSFKDEANAARAAENLKQDGQRAFYVKEAPAGEDWFRVYVGQFGSEEEARRIGAELKKKGVIPYFKPLGLDRKPSSSDPGGGVK